MELISKYAGLISILILVAPGYFSRLVEEGKAEVSRLEQKLDRMATLAQTPSWASIEDRFCTDLAYHIRLSDQVTILEAALKASQTKSLQGRLFVPQSEGIGQGREGWELPGGLRPMLATGKYRETP